MKKVLILMLCAAFAALSLSGCVSVSFTGFSTVVGSGQPERYEFNVGEITEVRIMLHCDIDYYSALSDTVTLEIHPNLREYVIVEESGGVLTVRSTRNFSWSGTTPVLTIGAPSLRIVSLSGAGRFTAHDRITADSFSFDLSGAGRGKAELDVGNLLVNLSGAGDLEITGSADTADLTLAGAGNLDALSLQTREASISLAGAGVVSISCSERLVISASGVGSVQYRGSPTVDLSRGGFVNVRQVN